MSRFSVFVVLLMAAPVWAAADEPPSDLIPIEQPDIPEPVESGQPMAPDVTVLHRGKETVEEYRVNGKLYRVKITPVIGPAYYLTDTDGDGSMDARQNAITTGTNTMKIPQWVLFSW